MIRDRLVVGIRDIALSQKLQLDADLTLEKAKRNIRQREAVSEQQRILGAPEEMRVDQLRYRNRKYPPRGKRPQTHAPHAHQPDAPIRTKTAGSERTGKTCSRCGRAETSVRRRTQCAISATRRDITVHNVSPRKSLRSLALTKHRRRKRGGPSGADPGLSVGGC